MTVRAPLALVLCVAAAMDAAADPASPPLIDEAIKDAAAHGHPLVVELFATWCQPCRWFERNVLGRAEVVQALAAVDFIRYDVDTPQGRGVARRFHSTGVPTFLVIGGDGAAVARQPGLRGGTADGVARWFVGFVGGAPARTGELADLIAAAAADPRDAAARLRVARYYRSAGSRVQAIAEYRKIVDADPALLGPAVATATAELDEMIAAETRIKAEVVLALAFARKYPESPLTTGRLAIAALSGRVDGSDIKTLLEHHLRALGPGADLAEALRLAIGLRMRDLAEATLARWERALPRALLPRLVRIETDLFDGHRDAARPALELLCKDPPSGIELQCYVLATAIDQPANGAPGIRRILSTASSFVDGLEHPGDGGGLEDFLDLGELAGTDLVLGNAVAHSLRVASARCADQIERRGVVYIAVRLQDLGGPPAEVSVHGRGEVPVAAERCIHDVVAAGELPRSATDLDGALIAQMSLEPGADWRDPRSVPPRLGGEVVTGMIRRGALTSVGFAAQGVVALGPVADFRALVRWELEAGVDDDDEATLAGRGLLGFGLGSDRWQFAALFGVGGSRAGARVPGAVEVPFELRLDGTIGVHRAHLWARGAWLYGEPSRHPEASSALFGADETAFGLGVTLALKRWSGAGRLFLGAEIENRAIGRSGLVLVGLPIGKFF